MPRPSIEELNAARARKRDKGGRPTAYRRTYPKQVRKLCEYGATALEIANFFEVTLSTIYLWRVKYKEFSEAMSVGNEMADKRVERSLYEKAMGYTFESEKVFQFQGEIVRASVLEHVPPSDKAIQYWLGNRKPKDWRDRVEVDNTGEIVHKFEEMDDAELDRRIKARQDRISANGSGEGTPAAS